MLKFKVGDEVRIVKHQMDSDEQYDIGDEDIIVEAGDGSSQPYLLAGKNKEHGGWWVCEECLELVIVSLENE